MTSKHLTLCLLFAISTTLAALPERETDIAGYSEAVIRGVMKKHKVPGVSFAHVDDQEIVTIRSFGFADLETRAPVEVPYRYPERTFRG